jgi:amino acid adenylation domain-containing protein
MVTRLLNGPALQSAAQVLALLAARGVVLHTYDGRLRSSAPPGAIDAELAEGLRAHRAAIMSALIDGRFYPGNRKQVLAAAFWRAEQDAVLDCARLTPAPQDGVGGDTVVAAIDPVCSLRLLGAVAFALSRWTGGDAVAIRVTTRSGSMPLRVTLAAHWSFAELCQSVLHAYRGAARFRRDGGEAMLTAGVSCQVELDLRRDAGRVADSAHLAWLRFVVAPGRERNNWIVEHLPAAFDRTQSGWFASAVNACLAYTADASISLLTLAARVAGACRAAFPGAPSFSLPPVSIAQLIEQQVERTPDAPALVAGVQALSYRELDAHANALALSLLENGAQPGRPLGILLERGPAVPICFLAGLKAGLCLAPLDPAWPARRLADALVQLAAPLLVVDHVRADLPVRQFVFADVTPVPNTLPIYAQADHPVYIVHTSGTTGIPKAALNFQRGLLNRLLFMNRYFGHAAARSVLQTTPHWFDSGLWQFFWPWINGGCSVVERTDEAAYAAAGPIAQLMSERVSLVDFTPSRLRSFLDGIVPGTNFALQHVIVGGEMLSPGVIAAFREKLPQAHLHNFYGPSETAIGVICADVTACAPELPVPIGFPLDNVYVRVVDRNGGELPVGAVGELLIGGACVGGGYVGNDTETARLFIPDPVLGAAHRVYRSGDLVRYLGNGALQCLGRSDGQIKLRGLRIEGQEIRHVLEACAGVVQAHVTLRGKNEHARLTAYVVLRGEKAPGWEAPIRQALVRRLPAHMVPNVIIALSELPLRSSGKVDESQLPDEQRVAPVQAPRGYRRAMAALWSEVLACGPVGDDDDFFARGGHSLLTAMLIARIREHFGVTVPLRLLLSEPVLAPFADAVLRISRGATCPNPVPLRKDGSASPLFLVHGGDGELTYARHLAAELASGFPVYGFAAPGLQVGEAPLDSVPELAAHYLTALRRIQPYGPYRLGGWSAGGMIAYEMARQLEGEGEQVAVLLMIDTPCYPLLDAASTLAKGRAAQLAQLLKLMPGADPADMPDGDDIAAWLARGRDAGWLHADTGPDEAERVLAVRLALARAIHLYRRAPPDCPVVLAVAADVNRADRRLGWNLTPAWQVIESPGNHMSIVSVANAPALALAFSPFLTSPSTLTESFL